MHKKNVISIVASSIFAAILAALMFVAGVKTGYLWSCGLSMLFAVAAIAYVKQMLADCKKMADK